MKITRIAVILLLGILLVSGLACGLLGEEKTPTPTSSIPSTLSAPTLSSPADGAEVSGTSVTFQWQASTGAKRYWLRISKNPSLYHETAFYSANVGGVTKYTLSRLPDDGAVYYWGVWSGNDNDWCPRDAVLSNRRSFVIFGGSSLTPKYESQTEQIYFSLTAWAKEPADLYIYDPIGSLLALFYVPPKVETDKITETIPLPPAPIGGTYKLEMYSEVTGELVWQGEQTFVGPKLDIAPDWSLNPHWVRGVGWDLQYLTMILVNAGDMPIVLNGLKLRLEKDGFSTGEISVAREGDAGAEYGWSRKKGLSWILPPWEGSKESATIVPWGSEEQHLFGQHFSPGEYLLYLTLSDHLNVLEAKELAFEPN